MEVDIWFRGTSKTSLFAEQIKFVPWESEDIVSVSEAEVSMSETGFSSTSDCILKKLVLSNVIYLFSFSKRSI